MEIRIQAPGRWPRIELASLWRAREMLFFLAWRDIKVRYKQTVLGVAWAVLQPLLTMVIFTAVFGRLARIQSDGIPYPLFSFAALLPWMFFANGLTQGANSLVGNANLITKVYFPRLIIPMAGVVSGAVDFLLALGLLAVMLVFSGYTPTASLWLLPVPMAMLLVTTAGVGFWLAALNVQYRDVRHTVPFCTQLWMYASPIVYPASLFSESGQVLYGLNPMAGVVEGFRWALFQTDTNVAPMMAVSAAVSLLLLVSGALYFQYMERTFADVV